MNLLHSFLSAVVSTLVLDNAQPGSLRHRVASDQPAMRTKPHHSAIRLPEAGEAKFISIEITIDANRSDKSDTVWVCIATCQSLGHRSCVSHLDKPPK